MGPGERGELCCRGPQIMKGYLNNLEATESTLKNGWLHSGDIAISDKEGYVYIVDRLKELIKVKGFQVCFPSRSIGKHCVWALLHVTLTMAPISRHEKMPRIEAAFFCLLSAYYFYLRLHVSSYILVVSMVSSFGICSFASSFFMKLHEVTHQSKRMK